jgi:gluconolactonase
MKTNCLFIRFQQTFCFLLLIAFTLNCPLTARPPVLKYAGIEKIATGFQFTEGPCWRAANYLVFSDIKGNTIYKWTEKHGSEIFLQPSGNSNGLAEDKQGRLLLAQQGQRCITRLDTNGAETTLVMYYDSKRLNSPNDIVVKSDGSIYFTDPPYGINSSQEELGFYGVYRLSPDGKDLTLLVDSLFRPNGLTFSPDETRLYVNDTNDRRILVYDVLNDGMLSKGKVFITIDNGNPDGIKVDSNGNLYVACSDKGIQIYSAEGQFIDEIAVPERTRNLAWGDMDRKTLYISAGTSVYRIRFNGHESIPEMKLIPGGEFEMGDHHDLGGLEHKNDELPVHTVYVDSFYIDKFETTNQLYCDYLNSAYLQGLIQIPDGYVYRTNGNEIYCETYPTINYSQIYWDGSSFTVRNNRENHPVIGVRWFGAIAYCNWLSTEEEYEVCYDLSSGHCDFSKNGFRLPTEAEWEYAGRGGQYSPYSIFPWGDDQNKEGLLANWPKSGDPYETGPVPWTTPVGFYNGNLHEQSDFGWPGSQKSYQTKDGSNAFGLYDMSGNVWEWIYDWYGREYYKESPYANPAGPNKGSSMPDFRSYRILRSGNWYNGKEYWGHGRVSNRNPSYYRGPDDPNHAWYHIGFRIARNYQSSTAGIPDRLENIHESYKLYPNYPNPFNSQTILSFKLKTSGTVQLKIYNTQGQEIITLIDAFKSATHHQVIWDGTNNSGQKVSSGIYVFKLQYLDYFEYKKMVLIR